MRTGTIIDSSTIRTNAAARNEGCVRLLQWSGKNKKYIPITVKNLLTSTPNNVE